MDHRAHGDSPSGASNHADEVDAYLVGLEHPMKEGIVAVREAILASDELVTERIKWEAPSFGFAGTDRVTFRLQPKDRFDLIFHRGAKVRDDAAELSFDDPGGMLTWVGEDRATLTFADPEDVRARQDEVVELALRWMVATADD